MPQILKIIRDRHSSRDPFDPGRPIKHSQVKLILEAAQWAPTPNNMQNFEIIVVDEKERLEAIGKIPADMSEAYLRENYEQVSFNEAELRIKIVQKLRPRNGVTPAIAVQEQAPYHPTFRTTAPLAICLLLPIMGYLRQRAKQFSVLTVLIFLLSGAALLSLDGCGGSSSAPSGSPTSYEILVTATSGSLSHSSSVSLTVK